MYESHDVFKKDIWKTNYTLKSLSSLSVHVFSAVSTDLTYHLVLMYDHHSALLVAKIGIRIKDELMYMTYYMGAYPAIPNNQFNLSSLGP